MTRYSMKHDGDSHQYVDPAGGWVLYNDAAREIEALKQKIARLESVVGIRDKGRDVLIRQRDALLSQNKILQSQGLK